MKRLKVLRWGGAAAVVATLFACAVFDVNPTVKKNYQMALVHPMEHSFESSWQEKMAEASLMDDTEEAQLRDSNEAHVVRWRTSLDKIKGHQQLAQLQAVHRMVNESVRYVSDYEHWNRLDRWGYPYETLVDGGDCEDFAILKAESLRYLGWPEDRFHVLIGFSKITLPPGPHSVLLVTMDNGAQVILDSAEKYVAVPTEDHHFYPMYAVTRTSLFHVSPLRGEQAPPIRMGRGKGRYQPLMVAQEAVAPFMSRSATSFIQTEKFAGGSAPLPD